jgi:hypothetical protein
LRRKTNRKPKKMDDETSSPRRTAIQRLDSAARGVLWALSLGVVATLSFAAIAPPVGPLLARIAARAGASELAHALAGLSLVLALQAALVFAATALASLVVELSAPVAAGAGLVCAALPALIAASVEGPGVLGPAPLALLRLAGACAAAFAGVLGRVALRRPRSSSSSRSNSTKTDSMKKP